MSFKQLKAGDLLVLDVDLLDPPPGRNIGMWWRPYGASNGSYGAFHTSLRENPTIGALVVESYGFYKTTPPPILAMKGPLVIWSGKMLVEENLYVLRVFVSDYALEMVQPKIFKVLQQQQQQQP